MSRVRGERGLREKVSTAAAVWGASIGGALLLVGGCSGSWMWGGL